jgi:hypothetical protein
MSALSDALVAMDKATPGELYRQNTSTGEGIRTKAGFICFMYNPSYYSGQDERYAEELAQANADAIVFENSHIALDWIEKALPWVGKRAESLRTFLILARAEKDEAYAELIADASEELAALDALLAQAKE